MKNQEITKEEVKTEQAVQLLKVAAQIAAVSVFTPEHVAKTSAEERLNEGLGVAISQMTEWSGVDIMEIFHSALEDANFHKEAAQVSKMLEAYNSEEVRS